MGDMDHFLFLLSLDNFCYPVSFPPLEIFIKCASARMIMYRTVFIVVISSYLFSLTRRVELRSLLSLVWSLTGENERKRRPRDRPPLLTPQLGGVFGGQRQGGDEY